MAIGYKWSVEEEHLLKLLRPTNTYQEIEIEFQKRIDKGIRGFKHARTSEAVRKKCQRDKIASVAYEYTSDSNPIMERWDTILNIQEQYKSESIERRRGLIDPKDITRKILSLSDIHFPLARLDLLADILNTHADADVVVLNGDILEGYIYSTFEKSRRIAALDEYRAAFAFVRMLSENFPQVILTEGNHDDRAARALKNLGFEKEESQVLRPCLLARIANGELLDGTGMLVEQLDFSNVMFQQRESWYVKIGKTLFIHPSTRGSSKPGHTVMAWYKKFSERYQPDEFDSIVCGHTHQVYKGIWCSTLLMEQGCLAGLMAYAWKKNVVYNGNSVNAYAVVYQDKDGNTCFNKSETVYLGEVFPPKKKAI